MTLSRLSILGLALTLLSIGCESQDDGAPGDDAQPLAASASYFAQAKATLAREGIAIDRTVWQDPLKFRAYMDAFLDAGASGAGLTAQSLLHPGKDSPLVGQNYCGPGSGAALPAVNDCVNQACAAHDACYDRCTGPRPKTCFFTAATSPCDAPFLQAINGCPRDSGKLQLHTDAVILLAQAIDAVPHDEACDPSLACTP